MVFLVDAPVLGRVVTNVRDRARFVDPVPQVAPDRGSRLEVGNQDDVQPILASAAAAAFASPAALQAGHLVARSSAARPAAAAAAAAAARGALARVQHLGQIIFYSFLLLVHLQLPISCLLLRFGAQFVLLVVERAVQRLHMPSSINRGHW